MAPGSYLVEVDNPEYVYEDIRIDINSKGKHRARKNNPVQPNQVGGVEETYKVINQTISLISGDTAAVSCQGQAPWKVQIL